MENINKILAYKIISKSSSIANFDISEMILKKIIIDYEKDNYKYFKEKISSDEKIDMYLSWKNMLRSIIKTKIITESYSYELYSCFFIDEYLISYIFTYVMYEDKLYDITLTHLINP
jgi:hypothetical protein